MYTVSYYSRSLPYPLNARMNRPSPPPRLWPEATSDPSPSPSSHLRYPFLPTWAHSILSTHRGSRNADTRRTRSPLPSPFPCSYFCRGLRLVTCDTARADKCMAHGALYVQVWELATVVQAVRLDIKAVFWTRDEGDKLWGRQEGGGGTDGIVELRHSPNH